VAKRVKNIQESIRKKDYLPEDGPKSDIGKKESYRNRQRKLPYKRDIARKSQA
jgi:hypothetical protein